MCRLSTLCTWVKDSLGLYVFLPFSFVAVMLLYTCFSIYVHMYSAKVVTGRVPFPFLNGLCVQDSAHKIAYVCVCVCVCVSLSPPSTRTESGPAGGSEVKDGGAAG